MALYYLLAMQLFISIAIHASRPIISLFADSQGTSIIIIGFLVSTYAFIPMLTAIRIGKWLDLYGARRVILLGQSGMLIGFIVPTYYPSLGALFFSQGLIGFCQACVIISLLKTIGNLPGNRDTLIVYATMTGSLGELLGPLISGFMFEFFGFQLTFGAIISFVLISLLIGVVLKSKLGEFGEASTNRTYEEKRSSWQLLANINLRNAFIINGLVLYSKDLFVAYFPMYGNGMGFSTSIIGVILSLTAGMALVVRLLQFWLVKNFGRSKVLTATLIISGIAFILVLFTSSPVILTVPAILLGAGLGLGQPLTLVYLMNSSPVERQGEVLGMRITFNRVSQFVAPFIFGGIGGVAGISSIFWASGCILLISAYFTRKSFSNEKEKVITEEKGF
ncbi:MAG: MFS transporter [Clostridia bacterium]|jgi:MFS family permease|nr:MFS transporter [Clostridia bacterium]